MRLLPPPAAPCLRGLARRIVAVPALALALAWSGAAADTVWGTVAVPLRLVNLNPFHQLYGVPAPFGTAVLAPGETEWIASVDMASYLTADEAEAERARLDGETWRLALAARRGVRERWEAWLEISAVAHRAGAFDAFIETWHDIFGLPQGNRDRAPRNRLEIVYADASGSRVDIARGTAAPGDVGVGVGYAWPGSPLGNDGVALRAAVRLPTGDADELAGLGGFSASAWAETSGALPWAADSRAWLYHTSAGALAAETPRVLRGAGGSLVAFGRFGVTWRPFSRLTLTAEIDARSSPWRRVRVAPLADAAVVVGLGGALRLAPGTTLEVAVTEDDGAHVGAPDVGLHVAMRWRR